MEIDYLSWTLNRLNITMQILSSEILLHGLHILKAIFKRYIRQSVLKIITSIDRLLRQMIWGIARGVTARPGRGTAMGGAIGNGVITGQRVQVGWEKQLFRFVKFV